MGIIPDSRVSTIQTPLGNLKAPIKFRGLAAEVNDPVGQHERICDIRPGMKLKDIRRVASKTGRVAEIERKMRRTRSNTKKSENVIVSMSPRHLTATIPQAVEPGSATQGDEIIVAGVTPLLAMTENPKNIFVSGELAAGSVLSFAVVFKFGNVAPSTLVTEENLEANV
ncbi:hypothetical protein BDZ97DRAFT_2012796 [Flammula alnicola]|nr:hypothetical protein BDZ97DRAFT_2012796 [Flammula alnicola]